jgi:hypothetical protein
MLSSASGRTPFVPFPLREISVDVGKGESKTAEFFDKANSLTEEHLDYSEIYHLLAINNKITRKTALDYITKNGLRQ